MDELFLQGVRILLVEDSFDTREGVRIWLKQHGADVYATGTAEEAFNLLPEVRPHVLLSDIALPGEDGYTLLQRIRALTAEDGGLVPAAAFTAYSTPDHQVRAQTAGFSDHIPKPVDLAVLLTVVRKLHAGGTKPVWTTVVEGPPEGAGTGSDLRPAKS